MTGPEAKLYRKVRDYLRPLEKSGELFVVKLHGGPMQQAGLPDLHITYRGRSIWIELKAPGGKTTPLQVRTIERIVAAGGVALVARSMEEVRGTIEALT